MDAKTMFERCFKYRIYMINKQLDLQGPMRTKSDIFDDPEINGLVVRILCTSTH